MKKIFVILIVSVLSASLFGQLNYDRTNNTLTIGGSESKIVMQGTTGSVTLRSLPTAGGTVLIPSVVGFDTIATRQFVTALLNSFSAMVYPSAGIPVSTGIGWATSITDNSVNWNTAFSQTLQWDGSNINLNAEAGRSSLGGTTVGQAIFTLSNPSAIRFLRINANNSVSALTAADFKTALSLTSSDVSLGNVTNESKTTMFTSPVFTGTIPRYGSPVSDTLATRAYARSVSEYSGGGGGGTWGLITGNITEQVDLSEVFGTKVDTGTVYTKAATNTLLSQKLSLSDTSSMLAPYPLTKSLPIDNWNTAYGWGDHSGAGYYTGTSTTIRQLLSSTATGLTYNNSTGVFSLTDGYTIPANTSITNWNAAHGWGNHASAGYYVGTDGTIRQLLSSSATGLTYNNSTGVFSLTDGYSIPANASITNWNTAFGWGDHSDAGYYVGTDATIRQLLSSSATGLTYTNSTGVFSLTSGYTIPLSTDITNWNTAFGWGDHSDAGYVEAQAVVGIVEGVVEDALEDAPIGVAVEDVVGGTTGRDRYMSPAQIESYVALHGGGGGSFSGGERIKFTIGDPGAPAADDNSFAHSALTGKQIDLFRDGVKSDYTYSSGSVSVVPDWQADENVELWLWPANTWEYLSLETSIEQGLINSVVAYWKFDEGEDGTAADAFGNYDLALSYRLWSSGMFSSSGVEPRLWETAVARDNGSGDLNPKGPFSLSMWFYLDSLPSEMVAPRSMYLYASIQGTPHFDPISLRINHESPNQDIMEFSVRNTTGTYYTVRSSSTMIKNTWHHIMVSFPETSDYTKMYLDGEDVSATNVTFSGDIYKADSFFNLGSQERYSKSYLRGYFDDVILLDRATTEAEAAWIWNGGTGKQLTTP